MSGIDHDAPENQSANTPAPVSATGEPVDIVAFLDDADTAPNQDQPVAAVPTTDAAVSRPGPGIFESAGWTALVLVAQFSATILVMGVMFIALMIVNHGRLPDGALELKNMSPNLSTVVFGLPGFLGYIVLIPLACWRISPAPLRKLNFSRPSLTQVLIICSCVLPLGFLSDALYALVDPVWDRIVDHFAPGFPDMGLSETMKQLQGASLPLLLFFLAVVPAVGEEWILRGLIGRGLVARWGIVPGILLTSMLFAVMHLDPPHVAAVFPIGIIMHIVYLSTRSFWMPILYHFLNNATVSVFTSLGASEPGKSATEEGTPWWEEWGPTLLAVPYLALALFALWKMRTRYVTPEGQSARREYATFEHVPQTERGGPDHLAVALIFGVLLGAQLVWLGLSIASIRREQTAPVEGLEPHPAAVATRLNLVD